MVTTAQFKYDEHDPYRPLLKRTDQKASIQHICRSINDNLIF